MNLSSAMITVKGQKLQTSEVREIYNKWKLCYYYKLQHLDKNAQDCPNKSKSTLRLMRLDDNFNDGDVLLSSKNV